MRWRLQASRHWEQEGGGALRGTSPWKLGHEPKVSTGSCQALVSEVVLLLVGPTPPLPEGAFPFWPELSPDSLAWEFTLRPWLGPEAIFPCREVCRWLARGPWGPLDVQSHPLGGWPTGGYSQAAPPHLYHPCSWSSTALSCKVLSQVWLGSVVVSVESRQVATGLWVKL